MDHTLNVYNYICSSLMFAYLLSSGSAVVVGALVVVGAFVVVMVVGLMVVGG